MVILVTGAAGFIGFHLCIKLIKNGFQVIGFDNINNYYDQTLKKDRIEKIKNISFNEKGEFKFFKGDLASKSNLKMIFNNVYNGSKIRIVINLAAQAGVRYSIENPSAYVQSNLVGFSNILEESRINNVDHFIYASSSSVYGGNKKLPFSETDSVDHPISLYAATKKSNELIAHTYSHLFNLPTTGLRFFTVYGPWGRPDMALFKFTKLISENKPIRVFNHGKMIRDFTYIDDVIESILLLLDKPPKADECFNYENPLPNKSWSPYKIFNIGNSSPTNLTDYINAIEKHLGKKPKIIFEDIQPGDVKATYADTSSLENWIKFKPSTSIDAGIKKFIDWYLDYYEKS
ncbi:SDR family NAD(P)-dependent oxidoreductase [Prochlorococcus marinus]|uniref:SDR family NAD(P)-dependent oxidoreductase n=1 Tax=Prochlorococcus marinus TaxID=1219 RepID=UPI001ADD0FC1|nr:SDR family NAD(P)-dependent oxidoreductase [Prochlorococcus marinus]MBO8217675.1 SDR family NAD(P)-dependent oxidoreductase [Prochlorococcus marinus XMU1405]MBW3040837.1 protein CapI [Prochlorococcus marinus str. MU1405]MBW3048296.1 protein CapI [Prochlorococcus marinus str. MU1406]